MGKFNCPTNFYQTDQHSYNYAYTYYKILTPGQKKTTQVAKTKSSDSAEILYAKAIKNMKLQMYDLAKSQLKRFVKEYPSHPSVVEALYNLGDIYYLQGDYFQAIKILTERYKKYPNENKAEHGLFLLAKALEANNKTAKACNLFEAIKTTYPQSDIITETQLKLDNSCGVFVVDSSKGQQPFEIVVDRLNIRSKPNTNSSVIGTLVRGNIVLVQGKVKNKPWLQIIQNDNSIGYISDQYVIAFVDQKKPEKKTAEDTQIAKVQPKKQEPVLSILKFQEDKLRPEFVIEYQKTITENMFRMQGTAKDESLIAEVSLDGNVIKFDSETGNFDFSRYASIGKHNFLLRACDIYANCSEQELSFERIRKKAIQQELSLLKPNNISVPSNVNKVALIIGIEKYEHTSPTIFAENDAKIFYDYAHNILGVPENNIKLLIGQSAKRADIYDVIFSWLPNKIKPGVSDLYIFYAGHGLALPERSYIIPYDARLKTRLLERTAFTKKEFYNELTYNEPKSVIIFYDSCFSGKSREEELLVADARQLAIEVEEKDLPDNFTILSAAAGDQFAAPLKSMKHGLFSYFLMRGLEGEADNNKDQTITIGELYKYVRQSVTHEANIIGYTQTPQLIGDFDKILVQW